MYVCEEEFALSATMKFIVKTNKQHQESFSMVYSLIPKAQSTLHTYGKGLLLSALFMSHSVINKIN